MPATGAFSAACGEQRQGGGAHGTHGGGTVGTNGFGDLTDGVRELFTARHHRHESLLGQSTVTDFTTLREPTRPVSPVEYGGIS